jgi:hypothetical protein
VIGDSGTDDVTIRALDIWGGRDVSTQACDNLTANCGRGVEPGDNWLISDVRIHGADSQGIGSPGVNLVVEDAEIDHNGVKWNGPENNGFAAGIKGGDAGGFTIIRSYVHANNQGIWCDVDCSNEQMEFVVLDSRITNNCSFGIHYENTYKEAGTSASARIVDNVSKGNAWWDPSGPKADIGIVSAEDAFVVNNEVGPSQKFPENNRGIVFHDRGEGPATGIAEDNVLNGDTLEGCDEPGVTCR